MMIFIDFPWFSPKHGENIAMLGQDFLQRPASFSSMLLDQGLTESAKMRAAEAAEAALPALAVLVGFGAKDGPSF